jgi:hypothetical protein
MKNEAVTGVGYVNSFWRGFESDIEIVEILNTLTRSLSERASRSNFQTTGVSPPEHTKALQYFRSLS